MCSPLYGDDTSALKSSIDVTIADRDKISMEINIHGNNNPCKSASTISSKLISRFRICFVEPIEFKLFLISETNGLAN
jgi:hypothetical protein